MFLCGSKRTIILHYIKELTRPTLQITVLTYPLFANAQIKKFFELCFLINI